MRHGCSVIFGSTVNRGRCWPTMDSLDGVLFGCSASGVMQDIEPEAV